MLVLARAQQASSLTSSVLLTQEIYRPTQAIGRLEWATGLIGLGESLAATRG